MSEISKTAGVHAGFCQAHGQPFPYPYCGSPLAQATSEGEPVGDFTVSSNSDPRLPWGVLIMGTCEAADPKAREPHTNSLNCENWKPLDIETQP